MTEQVLSSGERVTLPATYQDGDMVIAVFPARAKVLATLVASRPLTVAPGIGLLAIAAYDWRDTPVGAYREVGLAVALHQPPSRTLTLRSALWQMPVTDRTAMLAGEELFGFPKWMGSVSLVRTAPEARLTVGAPEDGGRLLELRWRSPRLRGSRRVRFRTELQLDGKAVSADFDVQAQRSGLRAGRARLTLGEHPLAQTLDAALLGRRALAVAELAGVSGSLGLPRTRPPSRGA